MPPSFANAVKAGAAVLRNTDPNTIRAGFFGSYWGPAALAKTYYERVLSGANAETLPLMFQNTTVAVALGQLAIEIGLKCPLYSLTSTPSQFVSTVIELARCELSGVPGSVFVVASDEAPDWLVNARDEVAGDRFSKQMSTAATAILLCTNGTSPAAWRIVGIAVTPSCTLDAQAMIPLGGRQPRSFAVSDTYILCEHEEPVTKAVHKMGGDPGKLVQLGFVETSIGNSLWALATACGTPASAPASRRLVCARCSDGNYVWIMLEWL